MSITSYDRNEHTCGYVASANIYIKQAYNLLNRFYIVRTP